MLYCDSKAVLSCSQLPSYNNASQILVYGRFSVLYTENEKENEHSIRFSVITCELKCHFAIIILIVNYGVQLKTANTVKYLNVKLKLNWISWIGKLETKIRIPISHFTCNENKIYES